MADDLGGVWRTIMGRRVFIKDGQDLSDAIKESGKWKKPVNTKHNKEYTNVRGGLEKVASKSDGTYNIETGERLSFEDGFMCSFFQLGINYDDKTLDKMCTEWANKTDGNIYAGVFGGEPEISFYFKNLDDCKTMMKQYNQMGIWDNALGNIDERLGYVPNPWYTEGKKNG